MHRDDLADLGESLRRELLDRVSGAPAALAGLEEDARRLLAILDGDLRELGAWLTSPSLEIDLPEEADEAPRRATAAPATRAAARAPERGGHRADGQGRAGMLTDGAPRDLAPAAPLAMAVSGAPQQQQPAGTFAPVKSLRDLAQWVRETSMGEGELERSERENPPFSVGVGGLVPARVSEESGDKLQDRPRERPLPPGIEIPGYQQPSRPGLSPGSGATVGSPGFHSRAGEDARGAPEDEDFTGAGLVPARVEAGRGRPPLRGWPSFDPLQEANPSLPSSPPPTGREGLQDILRLFSPSSPVRSGGRPGEEGRGDEGQATEDADAPERDGARLSEPDWDKLRPDVPPTYFQSNAPAPPPPAVSAASPAGEPTPPPFPEAPEVDVESLLEALARSVADEYKRFYGS
jgi:hypothetical protein